MDRNRHARWLLAVVLCGFALPSCRGGGGPPLPTRIVDLSPPLLGDINARRLGMRALRFLGTDGRITVEPVLPENPDFAFGLQALSLPSHSGAHIDAPARLLRGGDPPGRVAIERLFGTARIVDLRWHDRDSPIQISDLELGDIRTDDVVLLLAGYEPPTGEDWPRYASLSTQAAEWLVARGVRAVGTDVPALVNYADLEARMRERQTPDRVWAEYLPLFRARIPIICGLVNLDAILEEKRVVFTALPLPLTQGGGSPVRALALVY